MFGPATRLRLHPLLAISIAAWLVVALSGPVQAQTPSCFGATATITGAGTINGTAGNDVIVGSDGPDTINGSGGHDRICGLAGVDGIQGGLGNDQVDGGAGADEVVGDIFAESGNVQGGGNDRLFGAGGADLITGDSRTRDGNATGGGNDELFGGDGNERLVGDSASLSNGNATGGGNDRLEGGNGVDVLVGDSAAPHEGGIATGAGDDVLLSGPGVFGPGSGPELVIGDSEALAEARGSGGDDLLDLGADGGFLAIGDHNITQDIGGRAIGAGNDTIIGGSADEVLVGDSAPADANYLRRSRQDRR
jgi:Ca2+-binding RTX toxin-like protein